MSTTSKPQQAAEWNPTWLSLSGAIMWVVTRDQTLTRTANEACDNDRSIEPDVRLRLAREEECTGKQRSLLCAVEDAWPALRRLIADEKIFAEGKSVERRGLMTPVETMHRNDQIPPGDADNLIILSDVPGIKPKDALAPDEMYRFMNGQGRYWYDVRLRAIDVFREFGKPSITQTAKAEKECLEWLLSKMKAAPEGTDKSKVDWYRDACGLFPGLGDKDSKEPSRPFNRAWKKAMDETGAAWSRAGRKKSRQ